MLKRLLFVAPVTMAALSLSAVTAFANAPPGQGSADCVALSNQAASQKAKLDQDQAALNLAKQEVANAQTAVNDANAALLAAQKQLAADKAAGKDAATIEKDTKAVEVAKNTLEQKQAAVAAAHTKLTNVQPIVQQDQADLQQTQNQTTNQNVCANPTSSPSAKPDGKSKRGHGPSYSCVAISNERAAQSGKIDQDQKGLNAAKQEVANAQTAVNDANAALVSAQKQLDVDHASGKDAKVIEKDTKAVEAAKNTLEQKQKALTAAETTLKNLQSIVQKDQATLTQTQTQNTTQNVCDTTTTNNYYTTNTTSGSGAGAGAPSGSASGSGAGSDEPGLPQTGAAA